MKRFNYSKAIVGAFLLVIMIMSLIATGCSKKKVEFQIGFNEWVGFAPLYLAKEKGFFGNLDVQLHFIALEGDKRAGLYADRFQMICETIDMFQIERDEKNYPGKIVFAVDESYGGDGVLATKEIQNIKDLKGRKVASEPGLPAHFVLQYLLHKEGMTIDDIELIIMSSSDAAQAFIAGKVDIAGTYEPYLSIALDKREDAHLFISTKDLPNLVLDVAIVNNQTLDKRKSDVVKVYEGWIKAMDYYNNNPVESIDIMAKAFNLSSEEFKDTISGLRYIDKKKNDEIFGTSKKRGPIFENFKEVGLILKENKITKEVASPETKIDISIVNSIK